MQASFWLAVVARDAIIDGDLPRAKEAARSLEHHDYGDTLPADWKHWVGEMQKQAGELVLAPDLESAAQAVAAIGLSCGDCHAQKRAPDQLDDSALEWREPPDTMRERMRRHAFGSDQMWAGLIIPSDKAWQAGTVTLTRAPLAAPVEEGAEIEPAMAQRIEALRAIASKARVATSHPDRARAYGELIGRCAGCHYAARPE